MLLSTIYLVNYRSEFDPNIDGIATKLQPTGLCYC